MSRVCTITVRGRQNKTVVFRSLKVKKTFRSDCDAFRCGTHGGISKHLEPKPGVNFLDCYIRISSDPINNNQRTANNISPGVTSWVLTTYTFSIDDSLANSETRRYVD